MKVAGSTDCSCSPPVTVLLRDDVERRDHPVGRAIFMTTAKDDLEVHFVVRHLDGLDQVERGVVPPLGLP